MPDETISGKLSFVQKLKNFWSIQKNRKISIISLIVLGLVMIAIGFYFILKPDIGKDLELAIEENEIENQLYQSPLDGTMVSKSDAERHPLGVIIENHTDSRPQSGLSSASIVHEAIAEGGITRFLAIYGPNGSEKIGPVRSARTYYVDWIREFNGYFAHVGGNFDALTQIKSDNILDLDQFANPSGYWRDRSRKVSSEHTMYTSSQKLYDIASVKKYPTNHGYYQYKFKIDKDLDLRPVSQSILINFGNPSFNVKYNYNRERNSYLRDMGGKPHVEANNNAQIEVKNIIIQVVSRKATITKINENGWIFNLVGEGDASVFIDGEEIKARWKKDNNTTRTRYFNKESGAEIEFNAGTLWIETIHPELNFSTQ